MQNCTPQGVEIPAVGFGTARMDTHEEQREATAAALAAGYRHIDTAQMYDSERAVGEALAESDVDRADVFITTKLERGNRSYENAIESTHASRDRLGVETIDLLLIHSPNATVPHAETLRAMNELVDEGVVDHVGVSNFSVAQTREAVDISDAPILTNQVKYHARHRQDELLRFCLEADVMLTAYSPLGVGSLVGDEALAAIGARYDKTAAQVAIRWLLQQPMVSTIPMSSTPAHIHDNFDVFDFELSDDEMREIFALTGGLDDDLAAQLGL